MKILLESWNQHLYENVIQPVYHGSNEDIETFDLDKTREFGFHFGSKDTAQHRASGYLKKYALKIDNPIELDDVMKWNLDNTIANMVSRGYLDEPDIPTMNREAIRLAKENGSSLRAEKNRLLGHFLDSMGYDGIIYHNKGEAGGLAYIVWNPKQITELK